MTTEKDNLIESAEKYADKYSDDDRQDIKTDVLNAYFAGSEFYKRKDGKIIIDKLRPISEAPKDKAILINTTHGGGAMCEAYYRDGLWWIGRVPVEDKECIVGWIPVPIYKPNA